MAAAVAVSTALLPMGRADAAPAQQRGDERVCPANPAAGYSTCYALRRTDVVARTARPGITPAVFTGYTPTDIRSAYQLPSTTRGAGHTVAVVDAFDDPDAESDLQVYRSHFGLPTCTTANGCFRKVNQRGGTVYPGSSAGWADEISLDLDMVSAACPLCNILLVEAASALNSDLDTAVQEAGTLGATVISLSWGGGDRTDATNSVYHQAGRPILAATGDNGFGVQYPASSRYVIAVGGTRLTRNSTTRGWGETAWSNAGSGCSTHNPAVAPSSFDTGCVGRAEADLSAVADPGTGVAVYDSFHEPGWGIFGGTSASAPIVGAALALLPNPSVAASPQSVYAVAASNFYDVTSGSNGSCSPSQLCNARVGWDGPTGRGTPDFGFLH